MCQNQNSHALSKATFGETGKPCWFILLGKQAFLDDKESYQLVSEVYNNTFQMTIPFISYLEYNKINEKLIKDNKNTFNHILEIANNQSLKTFTELKTKLHND